MRVLFSFRVIRRLTLSFVSHCQLQYILLIDLTIYKYTAGSFPLSFYIVPGNKRFLAIFSSPGLSPGRAIVLPPGVGFGVGVGGGVGIGASKMLKFLR